MKMKHHTTRFSKLNNADTAAWKDDLSGERRLMIVSEPTKSRSDQLKEQNRRKEADKLEQSVAFILVSSGCSSFRLKHSTLT